MRMRGLEPPRGSWRGGGRWREVAGGGFPPRFPRVAPDGSTHPFPDVCGLSVAAGTGGGAEPRALPHERRCTPRGEGPAATRRRRRSRSSASGFCLRRLQLGKLCLDSVQRFEHFIAAGVGLGRGCSDAAAMVAGSELSRRSLDSGGSGGCVARGMAPAARYVAPAAGRREDAHRAGQAPTPGRVPAQSADDQRRRAQQARRRADRSPRPRASKNQTSGRSCWLTAWGERPDSLDAPRR
jgi:hypothetical protein